MTKDLSLHHDHDHAQAQSRAQAHSRLSIDEAIALITRQLKLEGETEDVVPYTHTVGRVLTRDIHCRRNVPHFDRAAVNGYAVRAEDIPGKLNVVGEIDAREAFGHPLRRHDTVHVATGARTPAGTDLVVDQSEVEMIHDGRIAVDQEAAPGKNITRAGQDVQAGQRVFTAGQRVHATDLAMMATIGALEVPVRRRPVVRIVPTGGELILAGTPITGNQTVEASAATLSALATRDGARPVCHPIVGDDEARLLAVMQSPGADVIVVIGGANVGVSDRAPTALRRSGRIVIDGLDLEPGGHTAIGFVGTTIVILAPGVPSATFIVWDFVVLPILQQWQGLRRPDARPTVRARLTTRYEKPASRTDVVRVTLAAMSQGLPLASVIPERSGSLSPIIRAHGLLQFPPGRAAWDAGDEVDIITAT
ncbi:MAG: molybdopterin molybdotransferase MoeA [Deltaproteobacteria bacterium]|nr:molybdopterin molybdotransferase MoeA [Deltaproteobacteria bacterium]